MKNNWVWKNKRNEKKKKQSLRGVWDWMGRDEKEYKNKRKIMLKCGVGVGKKISKRGAIGIWGWGRTREMGKGIEEGSLEM